MEENRLFGNKLRILRIEAGLTETDLAKRAGVSVSYINKIEKGALQPPSEALISELALILKTDKGKLLELANKIPSDIAQVLKARAIRNFKSNLKELRIQAAMSQYQFARKIGVDPSYINKIESGNMPPPSKKILLRMAEILNINKDELLFFAGRLKSTRYVQIKNSVRNFKDNLTSKTIRGMEEFGNGLKGVSTINARSFLRVTVALLLVVAVGSSLWFASPTPVKAITIDIDADSSATIGSSYEITVEVTVQSADILPVQSAHVDIKSSADPSTYGARITNLPMTDDGTSTSISALGTSGTYGTASVVAATVGNWGYGSYGGTRSAYGYAYGSGWGTYTLGNSGAYGYSYGGAYTGASTTITYTINWTPPSGWPTGSYTIEAFVVGSSSVSFMNHTATTFTLSAAAPTPAVGGDDGVPSVPSTVDVTNIVNEDGEFTSLVILSSADDRATLAIPKGTIGLTAEGDPLSEVTITNVNPPDQPPAGTTFNMGIHFDCQPTGATFDPPVLLTFEYNPNWLPAGATPDNLTIAYYDEDTGQWVELGAEDIEINPATNTITARVSHFTVFSVLVRVPAEPTVPTVGPPPVSPPVKAAPVEPVVIGPSVPQVKAPEIVYPAPTAPVPPAVPAPVPSPTPWLVIIIVLVVAVIVGGVLVWNYGFRRT